MIKKTVIVTQEVEVEVDETLLNDSFMRDFRSYMFDLDFKGHIEHLAQLAARGLIQSKGEFVEGYGKICDMGISVRVGDTETEIQGS